MLGGNSSADSIGGSTITVSTRVENKGFFARLFTGGGHGTLTVTSTANITFVRGANSGIISAKAQELVNSRHLPFCEVRVIDDAGNLLAIFTASGYRKEDIPFLPTLPTPVHTPPK